MPPSSPCACRWANSGPPKFLSSSSPSSTPSLSSSISSSPSSSVSPSPSSGTPSWNDAVESLTPGYPHPLFQFDLILYIGNQYNLASVDDAGVFSSSVLDQQIAEQRKRNELETLKTEQAIIRSKGLTQEILQEKAVNRWNGVLPSTYSGGSLPFVKTVK